MERLATGDGPVYVARDEAERGSDGPFYVLYRTPDREHRWGYLCGNCESSNTAMDTMGRIVCNDCPNQRKPTEWDAAHE
ncbi:DUF5816 domain-containing protein [Halalkalicoccus subterraneus]|uniref:DUF5816 domain-containing protein n=1 Tax=Halalkalicoccus subterraneus TaxID=2675002 RepID=UPI000EFA6719|nr:DUF5816 domain-containing protein [Halalkalicoccus subterraneus]